VSGLWPLVWRAIKIRPLRSGLTSVAVALGIAVVLGVQIVLTGLDTQALESQLLRAGQSSLDVRVDAGSGLSSSQVTQISQLAGVAQAEPLYEKRVVAGQTGGGLQGISVNLTGLHDGSAALRAVQVVSGRLPHPGSTSEVAIDQGLAQALTGRPNSSVHLGYKIQMITGTGPDEFTVVGFTSGTSGGAAFTRSAVFVDNAAMLSVFRLGLRTPLVALRLDTGADVTQVSAAIHAKLGQAVTTYNPRGGAGAPLNDIRPLLVLLTVLAVFIGAGVTANSAALATSERRREIGLMRAAGASARQVFRMFAAEVLIVSGIGVPMGIAAGFALGSLLEARFAAPDLPLPPVALGFGPVFAAVIAGFGAAVVGGMVPAISAARLPILTSLRVHPGIERQRADLRLASAAPPLMVAAAFCFASTSGGVVALGVALFLIAVVIALPLIVPYIARTLGWMMSWLAPRSRTAAADIARTRNRTALTVAGLSVSVAAAVAVSALTAGALTASDAWVSKLFVGDMVVHSPVTQRDAVALAIQQSPNVRQATPLRFFSEPVAGSVQGITAIDPTVYRVRGGLDVVTPDRSQALSALDSAPSFLVPAPMAVAAGWHVNDQLPVQTTNGIVYFSVAGVVSHSFPAGDGGESLVMSSDLARTYFGATATGFDDLVIASDGSTQAIDATAASYGMQAIQVSDITSAARLSLQHSIGLLLALAIVAVGIAMLAVLNTLVVNVRQGTRELALLRAVGMSRRQVLRLVLTEAALLAATATVIGVGVGCVIVLPMLRVSTSSAFAPSFVFPAEMAITLGAVLIATAVVAAFGPARRAVQVSVLSALRHE
jgi:putative ABC transport system permease protein